MKIKKCIYINNVDFDGKKIPNKFIGVKTTLEDDSLLEVPLDPANTHYAEIMRQVEAGELTIEEAE